MARPLYHTVIVVDNLLSLLHDEAKSFRGAEAEAESLKVELQILRATLHDSEPRLALFEEVKELWERINFMLNTCLCNLERRRPSPAVVNLSNKVRLIHQIYDVLKGYAQRSGSPSVDLMENVPRFLEDRLVGMESQKEEVVSMLVGESSTSTRSVISLVGIAGVGKTTLASIVYRSRQIQQHFDCHAWINVSQCYNFDNLFRHITELVCPYGGYGEAEMDTVHELISHLNRFLMKRRYVFVFDDVWQRDFFQAVNAVFPDNNKGSRIIITTRDDAIAASCDIVRTLQPLSVQRALELLRNYAINCSPTFKEADFESKFEELSREAVRISNGLPLVIWAIGDVLSIGSPVLSLTEILSHWQMQLHNLENEIGESPSHVEEVSRIFYHNYEDLPSRRRLCLMYFGIFPKGYVIPDVKLCRLWIAEGFVKEETGKTLEQVAETYVDDLIDRKLVQVSHINYDGTVRMCRVHNFMHLIISSRSKRYGICHALNEISTRLSADDQVCRLSVYGDVINSLERTFQQPRSLVDGKQPKLSSVFLFDVNRIMMRKSSMVYIFQRFKLLELLDFEKAPLYDLPNEVGKLSLLKYLSLRNTKVKVLPKSVGLLLNLQTLDVRNTLMKELPIHIQKLRKLRHLLASAHNNEVSLDSIHGVQIKEGIGCLENLQTLMTVEAHHNALGVIEELEKLRQLRWLSISKLTTGMVNILCSFIEKMNHLESLNLYLSTKYERFDLESISSPPPLLRRLVLKGRLEKLPDWIVGLHNLTVLGLSFSRLDVDPLKTLQCLPNLKFLWLHQAYDGEQLHFEGLSFQKLKQLILTELHDLRVIKIERGALPLLEELKLGPCHNDMSCDIQHLRNLQLLECYDMPDEFVLRLQPEGGSDNWKVKHVKSVFFHYRVCGSRYVSYKIGDAGLLDRVERLIRTRSNVESYERQLSFFYNDDEEAARTSNAEWSEQNSFFTDDIED